MPTGLVWPLFYNVIRKNSVRNTFGMVRQYPNGKPKPHQGWDFSAVIGEPCFAVAAGTVRFVEDRGDYGLQLCHDFIFNGKTYYAFYAHMQRIFVKVGDKVEIDTPIATTGNSGNASNLHSSEDHLHFEIRIQERCGLGLTGRISPYELYGACPLRQPLPG